MRYPNWLFRVRGAFASQLVDDVARSLGDPTPDELEDELLELGLRDQCREPLANHWRLRGGLRRWADSKCA